MQKVPQTTLSNNIFPSPKICKCLLISEALDVTKQKDMSGFYRHLYRQKLGDNEDPDEKAKVKEEEKEGEKSEVKVKQESDKENERYICFIAKPKLVFCL